MAIDISAVLEGGYERTIAPTGLQFAVVFYVISLLSALFSPEIGTASLRETPAGDIAPAAGGETYAPSLGFPSGIAGFLSLLVTLASVVVAVAAIRTFVAGETETIPREYARENLLWPGVNLVIGGFVFGLAVALGLLLLVIPGLFLMVTLFFWTVFVAVEDENFIEGFQSSWELTKGHRLTLFGLGIVVIVIAFVVSLVVGIPAIFLPNILGYLLNQAGSALLTVFFLGALAEAYTQLAGDEEAATVDTSL